MKNNTRHALVVGAGFTGAVCARELAEADYAVTLIDKRTHIGGNAYETLDSAGIRIHPYGPHIFHTDNKNVYDYLSRFTKWITYEHRVLGSIDGKYVPIPFNFASLDILYGRADAEKLKDMLHRVLPDKKKLFVSDLRKSENTVIREFGEFVFKKVFVNYTAKQWGTREVDASVLSRVPVVAGYDDRYFHDKYQVMPDEGYTALFEKLLGHPNITIQLECDAINHLSIENNELLYNSEAVAICVYTGPIDELFNYRYGPLPYRSLDLQFETPDTEKFQLAAVVNYPNENEFTRITEFKYLTGQKHPKTTILREYPRAHDYKSGTVPYYPIQSEINQALYDKYRDALSGIKNLYFCGRLAQYKYFNMDAAVDSALKLSKMLIKN
jgi:UDP-galactopyranose mutase